MADVGCFDKSFDVRKSVRSCVDNVAWLIAS